MLQLLQPTGSCIGPEVLVMGLQDVADIGECGMMVEDPKKSYWHRFVAASLEDELAGIVDGRSLVGEGSHSPSTKEGEAEASLQSLRQVARD